MANSKYFGKFLHDLMIYSEFSPLFRKVDSAKKQENTKCSQPVIPVGGEEVGGFFFALEHSNLQQVWDILMQKKRKFVTQCGSWKSVFQANRRLKNILQLSSVQTLYRALSLFSNSSNSWLTKLLVVETIFGQTRPSSVRQWNILGTETTVNTFSLSA